MSSRLFKRGKIWFVWFYDAEGRRVRRSTQCHDFNAARKVLLRFEREAQGDSQTSRHASTLTVDDAVNAFIEGGCVDVAEATLSMYVQKGQQLLRLLGQHAIRKLSTEDVVGYIRTRTTEGAARGTIHKELVTLRRTLKHLHLSIEFLPEYRVRYTPKSEYLTQENFQALLVHLDPPRQMWVTLAVFTGGRHSEIAGLRWEHIDWPAGTILLPGTKTQKSRRRIPLHPLLVHLLGREKRSSGFIVGEWANMHRDLEVACGYAFGIEIETRKPTKTVTSNDLRRTFATWLKQSGQESWIVAKMLGHTSSRMVELVYAQADHATMSRALSNLPGGEWDNCGTKDGALLSQVSRMSDLETEEFPLSAVLGPGIEPGTRGFSVRCSTS